MKRLPALALLAAALAAAAAGPAGAQCVMCKTALTGSAEGRAMMAHFNHGILLMVFAPYVIMGAFAVAVFRERIVHRASRLLSALASRAHR